MNINPDVQSFKFVDAQKYEDTTAFLWDDKNRFISSFYLFNFIWRTKKV